MNFFISDAFATISSSYQSNSYSVIIMLVLCGLISYFMIIRPQQKRAKIHKELIDSISKGDEVITTGGLIGRVVKVTDNDYIFIALNDSNEVIIKRNFVTAILPKGTLKTL